MPKVHRQFKRIDVGTEIFVAELHHPKSCTAKATGLRRNLVGGLMIHWAHDLVTDAPKEQIK